MVICVQISSVSHDFLDKINLKGPRTTNSPLYQTWPHDSPVEGEEPYLFWGHYVKDQGHHYYKYNFLPFDNLYR